MEMGLAFLMKVEGVEVVEAVEEIQIVEGDLKNVEGVEVV